VPQNIIDIDLSQPLETSLNKLQLPRSPLILLLGDFPSSLNDQIRSICRRVLAPIASDPGALILDNAACSGCAAAFGSAAIDQDKMPSFLGVVPNDRALSEIDPNHQRILRLPLEWTDISKYTFQIADALVKDPEFADRVVAVLFGGTDGDKRSVIRCAQRRWPVVVFDKTGGLAEQIIAATTPPANGSLSPPSDPELREIIETAILYKSSVESSVDDLQRTLLGRVDPRPETAANTLQEAWARFDELDCAALVKQTWFRRLELFLILMAVAAALFAILTTIFPAESSRGGFFLHLAVIITPIAISIIGAYNSHFRDGNKWILLRGAAEALKREIFRFRTKTGVYSDIQCQQTSRESKLAAKVKEITSSLEQSEVNKNNLELRPQGDPQRNNFLSPADYIKERLEDQIAYFVKKTRKLFIQLTALQVCIYVVGGVGTFLAAIKLDIWVALATAIVTAFATKLQVDQVENSLVQYNQTLASLRNIACWWKALSRWEKNNAKNIDVLVDQAETAMETETAGWVQQMQSALDKLTEKEPSSRVG
jgi:hypothetical protein